jgi:hypothetical protein
MPADGWRFFGEPVTLDKAMQGFSDAFSVFLFSPLASATGAADDQDFTA